MRKTDMRIPVLAALMLAVASLTYAVDSVPYEDEFYEVSEAVVTPHVAWAKPYAGGRPRVLFIAPWYCNRHTVEIVQRLDCDYTVAMTTVRDRLGYAESIARYAWVTGLFQEEVEADLRRKLDATYDVIVLGTDWQTLPLWAVYDILAKVESGTGLLVGYRQSSPYLDRLMAIGTDADTSDLLSGIPIAAAANLRNYTTPGQSLFRTSSLGAGRVFQLQYQIGSRSREYITPPESEPMTRQDYEIAMGVALRALLWCAKMAPAIHVTTMAPTTWPQATPPETVALSVTAPEALWRTEVRCEWTAADGEVLATTTVTQRLDAATTAVALPVPSLPEGAWFANVRLFRDDAVAAWACLPVTVTGDVRIAAIDFATDVFADDEPLSATVRVAGVGPGYLLAFAVVDAYGRVVRRGEQAAAAEVAVHLPLPPPACIWHELRVELRHGDAPPISVARAEFFRDWRRPSDQFSLLTWYGPARAGYMDRLINRAFAAAGVDIVYPAGAHGNGVDERCLESVRAGMTILPYICWLGADRKAKHPPNVRIPCLHDPAYRDRVREGVVSCAEQLRRLCPTGYSLGDENAYASRGAEFCLGEHSVAYFRTWLQRKYGSIAELNRVWHSKHKTFDDIGGILLADAVKAGEPAPWIDFRLCMEDSWTALFADLSETIGGIDPKALVGHEGSGTVDSYGAFDWYSMLRDLSMFVPYPGRPVFGNMVRSFRNPGAMSGYWYGAYTFGCGGRRPTTMRYFPWYCLFQAYNSSWYFNSYGDAGMAHELGFAPDLRALPSFAETSKECLEIKTGFDKLLLGSTRSSDGIAIYYSPVAIHENTFRNRPVEHLAELDSLCKVLNDLSLQYDFVSAAQLEAGILAGGKYRLLILPLAMAMAEPTAAAVAAFAKDGGAVLADLPPAVADEHGHAYATQPLASLFGPQPAPDAIAAGGVPGAPPATAGSAVLLNFTMHEYSRHRDDATGRALRLLVADVLGQWGVATPARVLDPTGIPVGHIETVRFVNGAATFLGIMPEDFNAETVQRRQAQVRLDAAHHVYDMRRKRYLGQRDTFPVTLETCRAELFALLPYVLQSVEMTGEAGRADGLRTIACGGSLLTAAGKPASCPHVVRLTVTAPDGTGCAVYDRKVMTADGRFAARWVLAESDPPGLWTITAADVATGIEERTWVTVE